MFGLAINFANVFGREYLSDHNTIQCCIGQLHSVQKWGLNMDLKLEGEHYINGPTLLECIIVVNLKQHLEIENKKILKGRIGH